MNILVGSLKRLYDDHKVTKVQLLNLVMNNKITIEEYENIIQETEQPRATDPIALGQLALG